MEFPPSDEATKLRDFDDKLKAVDGKGILEDDEFLEPTRPINKGQYESFLEPAMDSFPEPDSADHSSLVI